MTKDKGPAWTPADVAAVRAVVIADKLLPWMPMYVSDLLALSASLTPAQFGGLIRLWAQAWTQDPPCTLPDSDARLAAMSGLAVAWGVEGEAIRERLVPHPTVAGRLLDTQLLERWEEQAGKYIVAVLKGRLGGRPPKAGKNQMTKLGDTPGLAELRSRLSSELPVGTVRESLDGTKADDNPSLLPAIDEPTDVLELARHAELTAWLAAHPGQRIPERFTPRQRASA